MMGGKLLQATITTPSDPMRSTGPVEYLIDGERYTWAQIIARAVTDTRGNPLKRCTVTTRLRRGVSTWAQVLAPVAAGKLRSKGRFNGWVVNPAKPQAPKPTRRPGRIA